MGRIPLRLVFSNSLSRSRNWSMRSGKWIEISRPSRLLLLMHGNPFTHLSWHKFAPRLAREFTVVATDLRGYGDSEKPPGGDDHSREQ